MRQQRQETAAIADRAPQSGGQKACVWLAEQIKARREGGKSGKKRRLISGSGAAARYYYY
ncbi:hypothetical protein HA44_04040 [Mixta gaviniae]|nr:hypothetical protein HA44_04040 [Mixta gaviniae]